MLNNFNFKNFLLENKLGAYSKAADSVNEAQDVIYGTGDDDDYDKKGDAERTGARFVPITDPQNPYYRREPSSKYGGYGKPTMDQVVDKIAGRIRTFNSVDIKNYTYKKEKRAQAEEALKNAVARIVDTTLSIPQGKKEEIKSSVLNRVLGPIKKQWASYAQQKAAQSSAPSTGTDNEPQDASIAEELSAESYGGKNPEGDQLVMDFLKKVASDSDYSVEDAAFFVKNTIDSLFKS